MTPWADEPWIERVAITVTDLDKWIGLFEGLLGPGFGRAEVEGADGPANVAIHPAGVELVEGHVPTRPALSGSTQATTDTEWAANIVRGLG